MEEASDIEQGTEEMREDIWLRHPSHKTNILPPIYFHLWHYRSGLSVSPTPPPVSW